MNRSIWKHSRFFLAILCIAVIGSIFCTGIGAAFVPAMAQESTETAATTKAEQETIHSVQSRMDGILAANLQETGAGTAQEWIDGRLTEQAGVSSEWYILALSRMGEKFDFSGYTKQLEQYTKEHSGVPLVTRQKYALCLLLTGSEAALIHEIAETDLTGQGIMSQIFGLHLYNALEWIETDAAQAADWSNLRMAAVRRLCDLQLQDGGWALFGTAADPDITAMVLQALAPGMSKAEETLSGVVNRAVEYLSRSQQPNGDYISYGTANPESSAQVVIALTALGIDCLEDSRFIKQSATLLDGMERYCLKDGRFSHALEGAANNNATAQVFCALVALKRAQEGKGPLYLPERGTEPEGENTEDADPSSDTEGGGISGQASSQDAKNPEDVNSQASSQDAKNPEDVNSQASSQGSENTQNRQNPKPLQNQKRKPTSLLQEKGIPLLLATLLAVLACIVVLIKKKNRKSIYSIAVVYALAIIVIFAVNIQGVHDYYEPVEKENSIGTVELGIRCDVVFPEDGIILAPTEFLLCEGETVYDILTEASKTYQIQLESSGVVAGSSAAAYISGINYLYEYQHGELSGWVFFVNGERSSVGCGAYPLKAGDKIEWIYSCELGNDVSSEITKNR